MREHNETIRVDSDIPLNEQTDILPYNPNYEINRSLFKLTKILGEGEFGKVFRGELKMDENDYGRLVAVKVPNGKGEFRSVAKQYRLFTKQIQRISNIIDR